MEEDIEDKRKEEEEKKLIEAVSANFQSSLQNYFLIILIRS